VITCVVVICVFCDEAVLLAMAFSPTLSMDKTKMSAMMTEAINEFMFFTVTPFMVMMIAIPRLDRVQKRWRE
jgi:hypothetical protein